MKETFPAYRVVLDGDCGPRRHHWWAGSDQFPFATLYPALAASVGPDVMLQISQPDLPVVVRSADGGDFTTLAMPVKAGTPSGHQGES